MQSIKTVKVATRDGFKTINEEDFDPKVDKLFGEKAAPKKSAPKKAASKSVKK